MYFSTVVVAGAASAPATITPAAMVAVFAATTAVADAFINCRRDSVGGTSSSRMQTSKGLGPRMPLKVSSAARHHAALRIDCGGFRAREIGDERLGGGRLLGLRVQEADEAGWGRDILWQRADEIGRAHV